jgi:thiamine pyrophosphokinase
MEKIIKTTVIIADGAFPSHEIPLGYLREAERIVCCDGSAERLVEAGMIPDAIAGDMDSLPPRLKRRFSDRIHIDTGQETNDLTKAVQWCCSTGYNDIVILGATGKREDHSVGNISLLAEYSAFVRIKMVTDTGIFLPFHESCRLNTFSGQQISVFSIDPATEITSSGLRYPLKRRKLKNWWEGTLNEATGNIVELEFSGGPVLVFQVF